MHSDIQTAQSHIIYEVQESFTVVVFVDDKKKGSCNVLRQKKNHVWPVFVYKRCVFFVHGS